MRVLAATIACVMTVFGVAISLWAIALTLQTYLGLPIWIGIIVCAAVAGVYSAGGGLRAVALTDVMQVSVMFVGGIAIAILGLSAAGGVDGLRVRCGATTRITFMRICPRITRSSRGPR